MERNLDFVRSAEVFAGPSIELEDRRMDYSEPRFITFGFLDAREVVVVWTPCGNARRVISMRKANEREKERFNKALG